MIHPERFLQHLSNVGIEFFTGVPDSLMEDVLLCFEEKIPAESHIVAPNEGLSLALATGYYLSTGKIPLVYLQNSGLGNIVNPLTSLCNPEVYSTPVILLIGWRGMPGVHDEPQHVGMGKATEPLLKALQIPAFLLDGKETEVYEKVDKALEKCRLTSQPVALLVPPQVIQKYPRQQRTQHYLLSREQALESIVQHCSNNDVLTATTGKTCRELYHINRNLQSPFDSIFYCIGVMGLANHVALGLNLQGHHQIIMIDGDGALLMHLGSMASIAQLAKGRFVHILINNGCHESVGGQKTFGFDIDACAIARACGYEQTYFIDDQQKLSEWLRGGFKEEKIQFAEIRVNSMSRSDLGRPKESPEERKEAFMKAIKRA